MSKELLEKIDQTVADLINNEVELSNFVNDYFIQAERVQELRMFKTHTESLAEVVAELEDQNKRYREVLDRILNHDVYKIDITDAGKMADRALEGDPHESS